MRNLFIGVGTLVALSALAVGAVAALPHLSNLLRISDIEFIRKTVGPGLRRDLAARDLHFGAPVYIRIFKQESQLELWVKGEERYRLFKTYDICSWSGDLGPKLKEGDRQSPEGFYSVTREALNPNSSYHLSFNLGFPNTFDRAHGRTGSFLMVHGSCVSIGCYAMTDAGIEEIYVLAEAALQAGQRAFRVDVFPFRMTQDNLNRHAESDWRGFWLNLKQGYDLFETHRIPPKVRVRSKRYRFAQGR